MKNVRIILSAAIILACIASALAFEKAAPDIRQCVNGVCVTQNVYSTMDNGNQKNPPFTPFTGVVNAPL